MKDLFFKTILTHNKTFENEKNENVKLLLSWSKMFTSKVKVGLYFVETMILKPPKNWLELTQGPPVISQRIPQRENIKKNVKKCLTRKNAIHKNNW